MTQIQQIVHAGVRGGVGQVELVGAHGHRLQTDAEHLRLAGVDDAVVLLGVNLVERIAQALAQAIAVSGHVLQAVGDPDVAERLVIERLADLLGDLAAGLAVADPEVARRLIGRGQRQLVVHHGMAKDSGIEIDAVTVRARPRDPRLEVLVLQDVAVDPGVLVGEDGVGGVQIDALGAGHEGHGGLEVTGQLLEGASAARVVARGLDAAGEAPFLIEAEHVVALPAVHRDGLGGQLLHHRLGVDAEGGVLLAGQIVHGSHRVSFLLLLLVGSVDSNGCFRCRIKKLLVRAQKSLGFHLLHVEGLRNGGAHGLEVREHPVGEHLHG